MCKITSSLILKDIKWAIPIKNLRCFVARQILSRFYALCWRIFFRPKNMLAYQKWLLWGMCTLYIRNKLSKADISTFWKLSAIKMLNRKNYHKINWLGSCQENYYKIIEERTGSCWSQKLHWEIEDARWGHRSDREGLMGVCQKAI